MEKSSMTEPEVSLRVAMYYIKSGKTSQNVKVSIDGAHIKTKNTVHFDIVGFLQKNGYFKCDGSDKWQGKYKNEKYFPLIVVSSEPGGGDVVIYLNDGNVLYVESKKIKSGNGGEYPAIREAIGQLMTGCPKENIPVVALPYTEKSNQLANEWAKKDRICDAGICFMLVCEDGNIRFMGEV